MQAGIIETLIGITEIAVALAGFSGVVVVFGSRDASGWHPGDRLRLGFLIESSFTAGGIALLALLLYYFYLETPATAWMITSGTWALYMLFSLYSSHRRIKENSAIHDDIDEFANGLVTVIFCSLILVQIGNVFVWTAFGPLMAALCFNLAGSAMQFARLIKSAFH